MLSREIHPLTIWDSALGVRPRCDLFVNVRQSSSNFFVALGVLKDASGPAHNNRNTITRNNKSWGGDPVVMILHTSMDTIGRNDCVLFPSRACFDKLRLWEASTPGGSRPAAPAPCPAARCLGRNHPSSASRTHNKARPLTRSLLLAVPRKRADDGVLAPAEAVPRALGVAVRLRGAVLGLAAGVLVPAGRLPVRPAGRVADALDGGALEGVELARRLAVDGVGGEYENAEGGEGGRGRTLGSGCR